MKKIIRLICIILCLCTLMLTACNNSAPEDSSEMNETIIHTHIFGNWNITKEATCTEEGQQERSCICGIKETENIAKTAHQETTDDKDPTALTPGTTGRLYCSKCDNVLNEGTTLKTLKDYVLNNTTLIQNGAYHYSVFANELIPSLSGLFQIAYSDSRVSVDYLEYIGTSGAAYNFTSIDFYDKNAALAHYGYSYNLTIGNTTYCDLMWGTFEVSKLYEVDKFIYQKTSSTIGGSATAQAERFNEYGTTAATMSKNIINLLDAFLEKENFGYGVEVFGFTPNTK